MKRMILGHAPQNSRPILTAILALAAVVATAQADIVLLPATSDLTLSPPSPSLRMQWAWQEARPVPKYAPLFTVTLQMLGPDGRTVGKPIVLQERETATATEIDTSKLLAKGQRWLWQIEAGAYMPFYGFTELHHIGGVFDFGTSNHVAQR